MSIFWISIIIFINSFGLIIIYFNVFGTTARDFIKSLFFNGEDNGFITTQTCWALVLAVIILPGILMKSLAEIKILSASLFIFALIFVFTNVIQLLVRGNSIENPDHKYYSKY